MIAFKRVANIIPDEFKAKLNSKLLSSEAEIRLYEKFTSVKVDVLNLVKGKHYLEALNRIAEIRPFVDKFFDDVMVMDKDEAVKNNRLSLMGIIAGIFMDIADLKKIAI
jgi:glycyl-tRNA synthetase beta chain